MKHSLPDKKGHMKKYPFKFLDAYNQQDADFFFGRSEEIAAMYEMVFQHNMLVIYGASGTGKTSLIQCGLAGKFKSYDWLPLTIRRGEDINTSLEKALLGAGGNDLEEDEYTNRDASAKLHGLLRLVKGVYVNNFKPIYLIFDQFEELYVLGTNAEEAVFIDAVIALLQAEQPLKIIFSVREEYLGHLYEFEKAVPQLLRKKLRVEPMGYNKVAGIIEGINNSRLSNTSFNRQESAAITQGVFERIKGRKKTLSIQLPYLQVFLDKLYMETTKDNTHTAEAVITMQSLNAMGDIGDVLRDFLEEQVKKISGQLSTVHKNADAALVWQMLSPFCTLEATKEPISKMALAARLPGVSQPLLQQALEAFINGRIINYNEHSGLYELAHDSLALTIAAKRTDEEIAVLEVQRLIKSQVGVKSNGREFFTERQLLFIEPYLQKFTVTEEEQAWLVQSRQETDAKKADSQKAQQEELRKTKKRLSIVYSLLGVALLAFITAGYFWSAANEKAGIARANYLNAEAKSMVLTDPTLALQLAAQAMMIHAEPSIAREKIKIFAENIFYTINAKAPAKIVSAALSPDGKKILTGSTDNIARLWNLDGSVITRLQGHAASISAVCFSPDGKTIVTGAADKTARIWNLDGSLRTVLKGHEGAISTVAFSPDGQTVATGAGDNTARLWNIDGTIKTVLAGHQGYVTAVSFAPNGQSVLTGSVDRTARVWTLDGQLVTVLEGHADYVYAVAFSPNGQIIATGSRDKTARLWNLQGKMISALTGHTDQVSAIAFSPDGQMVLTGSFDQTARLWNLAGKTLQELKGHTDIVTSLAFSADGKTVLTSSYDSTARLWTLDASLLKELRSGESDVYDVAFSPDGKTILTANEDQTAKLWTADGVLIQELTGHTAYVSSAVFSPDGKTILTGSGDKTARLWGLDGVVKKELAGHTDFVYAVAFSPDDKTMLTGSRDKTAILWDTGGNAKMVFKGHDAYLTAVAFSPDGQTVLTGSGDKTARLWTLDGNMQTAFKGHSGVVTAVSFSADGQMIATGSSDKTIRLWNADGKKIGGFRVASGSVSSLTFAPDGKSVLAGYAIDQSARLWDLEGNMLKEFKGHADDVSAVAFSPDGKMIATGSRDNSIRLWNAQLQPVEAFLKSGQLQPLSATQKKQYGLD
jgi:WD40 repeat protein/AAA+ ATPase superfamily predicted ATPase